LLKSFILQDNPYGYTFIVQDSGINIMSMIVFSYEDKTCHNYNNKDYSYRKHWKREFPLDAADLITSPAFSLTIYFLAN